MTNIAKYLCAAAIAGTLCIPAAFAQYSPPPQDQTRHDQDDRNRADQDQNRTYQQGDRDRDDQNRTQDQDRDRDSNRGNGYAYGQNPQWRNSKAYRQGIKDGEHDRSRNKDQNVSRHHWKNDQDRQAYEAGYMEAYGGNSRMNRSDRHNDHDRDDMNRRDRDQR